MSCARVLLTAVLALLALASTACHKKTARTGAPRLPSAAAQRPLPPAEAVPGTIEYGYASWYGNPYHGRKTSSGEVYNMYDLTAAHRTLPLGTEVEVTNLENGQTVLVRINDRGPFIEGRIIDLSLTAARAVSVVGPGTAMVQVKVLRVPPPGAKRPVLLQVSAPAAPAGKPVRPAAPPVTAPLPPTVVADTARPRPAESEIEATEETPVPASAVRRPASSAQLAEPVPDVPLAAGRFTVQVGAFSDRRNAERVWESLSRRFPQHLVTITPNADGRVFRVWVGSEANQEDAASVLRELQEAGAGGFVIRMD